MSLRATLSSHGHEILSVDVAHPNQPFFRRSAKALRTAKASVSSIVTLKQLIVVAKAYGDAIRGLPALAELCIDDYRRPQEAPSWEQIKRHAKLEVVPWETKLKLHHLVLADLHPARRCTNFASAESGPSRVSKLFRTFSPAPTRHHVGLYAPFTAQCSINLQLL